MSGRQGYRDVVDIKSNTAADGSPTPDYSGTAFVASVPCKITARGGNEQYRGRTLEASITHAVEMQYIDGVLASMRLDVVGGVHTGRKLNVIYAIPVEGVGRARKLELHCISEEAT